MANYATYDTFSGASNMATIYLAKRAGITVCSFLNVTEAQDYSNQVNKYEHYLLATRVVKIVFNRCK